MATAPYGVRLIVGAAVTALDETRKLPQTILMYPMTMASNFAQMVMKVQQDLASLVIRGDAALETIFPAKDEQPDWATFDEDLPDAQTPAPSANGDRRTEGRFALYSVTDPVTDDADSTPRAAAEPKPEPKTAPTVAPPPIAEKLDYASLTLAQLRARLTSLSVADLKALLAYEESSKARAPFQTLLANRITRATAK